MVKKILSEKIINEIGLSNSEFIKKLDQIQVINEVSASVVIAVSSNGTDYVDIATITGSGFFVPNGITNNIYVKATTSVAGVIVTA